MTIPTHELREAIQEAPVLPWAHTHDDDGTVSFYSPGHPGGPIMAIHGADEATIEYVAMALNNVENILDHIDRPLYPDQFADLTDDERRQRAIEKMDRISTNLQERMAADLEKERKANRKATRTNVLMMTLNGVMIGVLLTQVTVNLLIALN